MTRRAHVCPQCQRPFPPALVVSGSVRQRLVNIIGSRPDGVPINELVDQVYAADPDGGPLTAPRSVNVMIHKANAQLRPQGYQIKATLGRGARYRLIKIDAPPNRSTAEAIDKLFAALAPRKQFSPHVAAESCRPGPVNRKSIGEERE